MRLTLLTVFAAFIPTGARAENPNPLAQQARGVLERNCHRCHGKDGSAEGGFDYVLDVAKLIERKKIVPKNLEKSKLYRRPALDGDMPPEGEKPRPSAADLAVLAKWLEAGAPAFVAPARPIEHFISERDIYKAMHDDLLAHPDDARHLRYITLAHLQNNPRISAAELRYYRAAVAKLLNSLSWKKKLVVPRALDPQRAVLAFDLRDLDWDLNDAWLKLIGHTADEPKADYHPGYPYALQHHQYPEDKSLNALAVQVYQLTGTRVPAVRADWLIAAASLPPLYHDLLNIPRRLADLEGRLHFDIRKNFQRDRLQRAGLLKSGVSANANRLIERHEASYGYFWISYDFRSGDGTGNLARFPLGPLNLFGKGEHPYPDQAFVHAGGEAIWRLPNGMQAHLLIDVQGNRINEGPPDVVRDKNESAGRGTAIVNGFSRMACHKHGTIAEDSTRDAIRDGTGLGGDALDKLKRLYPERKKMDRLLEDDQAEFLDKLEKIIGPWVRVGPDKDKDIKLFPEPISLLGAPFLKGNITLEEAAFELGLQDPKELAAAIKFNERLRQLGLGPLANGELVKREVWQSVRGLTSVFQETAAELKRGTAFTTRR